MVIQIKKSPSSEEVEISENLENLNSKAESAAKVLKGLKKRQQSSINGFDSLNILRSNIQYFFNSEIDNVMKNFIEKFFQPAIVNIKKNTDETIDENQIKAICRNLLESCAKTQYSSPASSSSPTSSSSISNTPEIEVSDSDNSECSTSLLHQALKRKRTESETENLYKRQFFITTANPNTYFNPSIVSMAAQNHMKPIFNKPSSSSSLLTSALTSPPKAMRHFGNASATRPIFRIIPANQLAKTHVELTSLLNSSKLSDVNKNITTVTSSPTSSSVTTSSNNSSTNTEATTITTVSNSDNNSNSTEDKSNRN